MNEEKIEELNDRIEELEEDINSIEAKITDKMSLIEQLKDMILNLRYN